MVLQEAMLQVAIRHQTGDTQTLLAICAACLAQTKEKRQRVAFLVFLVLWLFDSPFAVKTFLSAPEMLGFLVHLTHEQVWPFYLPWRSP